MLTIATVQNKSARESADKTWGIRIKLAVTNNQGLLCRFLLEWREARRMPSPFPRIPVTDEYE